MPVVIVVGVQWGDEGKGKLVDYLTEKANLVVRFQGGNNAGHTVIVGDRKTALRLIPSGILRAGTRCLLAAGVVIDPSALLDEIESLELAGINVTPQRLGIAGEVNLIMPYHRTIDNERERVLGEGKIGTTGRGIGPCYEDAVSRAGIRLADLVANPSLPELVQRNIEAKNSYLESVLSSTYRFNAQELLEELGQLGRRLKPYIANVSLEIAKAIKSKNFIVFEGAQGSLLDINHGTYPYVTSSNTLAGYACASGGFGPNKVDHVLGICKAYSTRVGSGPFPTEDHGADGDRLRSVGGEFGTVTGRPRRCGWFDSVVVRRAIRLNGIDSLIVTKLDVLSGFKKIKIGHSYNLNGQKIDEIPVVATDVDKLFTEYEELDGWDEDLTSVRSFSALPLNAQKFLKRLEAVVDCEIGGFSVGPEREQTVILSSKLREFASI